MSPRRSRASRRLVALGVVAALVVAASLLAGIVTAAHRAPSYRHDVDASFAAEASVLIDASSETGHVLAEVMADPAALGRPLLEARLQLLDQAAAATSEAAAQLVAPPPDADAAVRIVDALRLRADAVAAIRSAMERLLGLTPIDPAGTPGAAPTPGSAIGIASADAIMARAGAQLVAADRLFYGLPRTFYLAGAGAQLPQSQWTSAATGRLLPATLEHEATAAALAASLEPTIDLRIVAVETTPLPLPLGAGYPIPPSRWLDVAISVVNDGSASTTVAAVVRVTPLGRLGRYDAARATGTVSADDGVALDFPALSIVPGERCTLSIALVRPFRQTSLVGLRWMRTVVVGQNAPPSG